MRKENGFSLLEVSVAVAIMAALTGFGITLASNLGTGNATTAGNYEAAAQGNIDNASCEVQKVSSGTGDCATNGGGGNGGNGGGAGGGASASDGVTAIWNGSVLSYSVNPAFCNITSQDVGYYYLNTGDGTTLMNTNSSGSYIVPSDFQLGRNLGYGITIASYYVMVQCDGVATQSNNYVS